MGQAVSTTNQFIRSDHAGHLRVVSDVALNDSDKTLTVTAGRVWYVLYIYAKLIASATVGNRLMSLIVADAAAVELYRNAAAAVQGASATEYYAWLPQIATPAETVATFHHLPLPFTYLPAGYTLRVYDNAAIDAAADDLTLSMLVVEYEG